MKRKKKVNGFMRYIETDIINLTDDLKKNIGRTMDTYRLIFNKSLEYIMNNFDCYIDDKEKCLYFKSKPKFINAVTKTIEMSMQQRIFITVKIRSSFSFILYLIQSELDV